MIKKILSLLIIFVLLLSAISCTESGVGNGLGSAFYTATYEEVKSTIDVIYERKVAISDKNLFCLTPLRMSARSYIIFRDLAV